MCITWTSCHHDSFLFSPPQSDKAFSEKLILLTWAMTAVRYLGLALQSEAEASVNSDISVANICRKLQMAGLRHQ